MKLGLGTVQFGMSYGVSNQGGRTPPDEVAATLAVAREGGIDLLDTAPTYGTSEQMLGTALDGSSGFRIVTKTAPLDDCATPADAVKKLEDTFARSLENLGMRRVYAVLLHRASDLAGPHGKAVVTTLRDLKRRGLVQRIGVSIYVQPGVEELIAPCDFDIVQLPINLLDQRLLGDGTLKRLKQRGIEIHARSLFLQGLLLMDPAQVPGHLVAARPSLQALRADSRRLGADPLSICLRFADSVAEIDVAIVGVNHAAHLREIIAARKRGAGEIDFAKFAMMDPSVLDPSLWPRSAN